MTNEERDLITQFVARVSGARAATQPPSVWSGSVPATTPQQPPAPPLPPVDPQADQHIHGLFQQYPEAPYRLTQLAFVQEHALTEAQNRIQRLEWELRQAQQQAAEAAAQQAQQPPAGSGGGFFGSLFGGRAQPQPQTGPGPAWNRGAAQPQQPPPPSQYPPNYQPGMFQSGGGTGFFGSALRTAAGVGGGILAADALMNLFSGSRGGGGGAFGGSPWGASSPADSGYVDQGTWDQGTWDQGGGGSTSDQNYVDNGSWDQPTDTGSADSSWTDGGSSDNSSDWGSGGDSGGGDDSLC